MTGFGKATGSSASNMITVEIRSLNSKYLELSVRLPSAYKTKELETRSGISKHAVRGKVDLNVTFEPIPGAKQNLISHDVVKAYIKDLKRLEKETGLAPADPMDTILRFTNVLAADKSESDEKEWSKVEVLIKKALKEFNEFREKEGRNMLKDMESRIRQLEQLLKKVEKIDPGRIKNVRSRLRRNFDESEESVSVDNNRFEQELIYYLEKMDINEEKVRLKSHLNYLKETIKKKDANGKKIGFILQEVGREINTIGSKASDAGMQRHVVEMKDELEKMKEQTANII
jgi:uncharacterized protein (TIGR00255 family)